MTNWQPPANAGRIYEVLVRARECANPNNPRGRRTFEWRPWQDELGEQRKGVVFNNPQVTYYYREPGEVSGGHCHRGDNPYDPDRNPEEIFFCFGDVEVEVEDLWRGKMVYHIKAQVGKPVVMRIPPWVLHTFRVGTRGLHFMESKRNPYSRDPAKQDVVSEEEFRAMQLK